MGKLYVKNSRKAAIYEAVLELRERLECSSENIKDLTKEKFKRILISDTLLDKLSEMDEPVETLPCEKSYKRRINNTRTKNLKCETTINTHMNDDTI